MHGPGSIEEAPGWSFDLPRLQLTLFQELADYDRAFEIDPVPVEQQMRGLFLVWVAAFLPEAITALLRGTLQYLAAEARRRKDFAYLGWFRALPLEIALFALTDDDTYLQAARSNFDHHKLELRRSVFEALALVADRMPFSNSELLERTARNLAAKHFHSDWCVHLLAVTRGNPVDKRDQMIKWFDEYALRRRHINPYEREVLESLPRGVAVQNPFLAHFIELQQYALLRLASSPRGPVPADFPQEYDLPASMQLRLCRGITLPHQNTTELSPIQVELPVSKDSGQIARKFWQRLKAHPLMHAFVRVEGIELAS